VLSNPRSNLVIRIVLPDIRDEGACLGVEPPEELAGDVKEVLGDQAGVRDNDDVVLGHTQPVDTRFSGEARL